MQIGAIQPLHTQAQGEIVSKEKLSSTDLKTYSLVVLSYLLIGIGILIACSSPYIAFTIHPMVAMAAPVAPIATGVWVYTLTSNAQEVHSKEVSDSHIPSLRGIVNRGQNCWLNAALQAVFNLPVFRKRLEKCSTYSSKVGPLASAFQQYEADQCDDRKKVSGVDSQKIRLWLSDALGKKKNSEEHKISPDIWIPEDPLIFMKHFLLMLGHSLPVVKEVQITKEYGKATVVSSSKDETIDCIDLSCYFFEGIIPVHQAFDKYFDATTPTHKDVDGKKIRTGARTIKRSLESSPEDFFVQFNSTTEYGLKLRRELDVPLELNKKQFGEGTTYRCDFFFIHEGSHSEEGHYKAAIFLNGHWWLANDSLVTALSSARASELLKTSPFVHYSKVSAASAA